MTDIDNDTLVTVRGGKLRGVRVDGLTILRGVRYATAARFAAPVPEPPWPEVRDATEHGAVSPQPSHDSAVGACEQVAESEDCLNLTIVTPAADDARRPVLVWLHGGSYRNGAGSWERYRTDRLAREGDVVVVSANYRLGALGYLRAPGVSDGNLGLLDQIEALRWVRDNAAALGGDPSNITVVGQSSGAHSIACMLGIPSARALFDRAVLQSPPLGLGLGSPARAERAGARFLTRLGKDPHAASVAEVVAAQSAAEKDVTSGFAPVWGPVAGTGPMPDPAGWRAACQAGAEGLEVILGTTRREIAYFVAGRAMARRPIVAAATWLVFARPTRRMGKRLAEAGARVSAYRLDGPPSRSPFRAAHCTDLPLLFGDEHAWADAPMLAGRTWAELTETGKPMRAAWLSFVARGADALAESGWAPYAGRRRAIHRFG
ncbi:carboxylesterase/lipase family protein [Actinoplanes sp. TBRC 11911]|uniref:carboxylesterase family protein n=1 Tax=Actinoplanes sp. TBRC 11911 TaxID=2729386 RepID=UPI00145DB9F6|nr:carboxylesterase family protein [Actinoplanes sp. TBRC 11911]NMO50625.1 carboxylesterase/lipase family protein [Actinoplanes sp. TBRC 11911]